MKNADRRVYVAFLMGHGDGVVVRNAERLMAKRNVNADQLYQVKVQVQLSMDAAAPGVTDASVDAEFKEPQLKLAIGQLTGLSELILLGHGGKRLFAGL